MWTCPSLGMEMTRYWGEEELKWLSSFSESGLYGLNVLLWNANSQNVKHTHIPLQVQKQNWRPTTVEFFNCLSLWLVLSPPPTPHLSFSLQLLNNQKLSLCNGENKHISIGNSNEGFSYVNRYSIDQKPSLLADGSEYYQVLLMCCFLLVQLVFTGIWHELISSPVAVGPVLSHKIKG